MARAVASDILYLIAVADSQGADSALSQAIEMQVIDHDMHIYSDEFRAAQDEANGYFS